MADHLMRTGSSAVQSPVSVHAGGGLQEQYIQMQQQQQQQQQQGQAPGSSENDNIKVVVRIRPLTKAEVERNEASVVSVAEDARSVQVVVPGPRGASLSRGFAFHGCLHPRISQPQVFAQVGVKSLLQAAMSGYAATVLAYGQTGSGKTYTMSGVEELIDQEQYRGHENDGLITRSMLFLFESVPRQPEVRYTLRASYLEIYNEQCYDLLATPEEGGSSPALPVRWEGRRGFFVQGLTLHECRTLEDAFNIIRTGTHNRRVGSHELNKDSSRSHSMFTMYIESTTIVDGHPTTRFGKVSFVDLAGSERLKQTKSSGDTLKETGNINRSLFALGKVIAALGGGADRSGKGVGADTTHIPYRDSKLTKLLMDSLGGSSLALMIATCSPTQSAVEETLSTLYYATTARAIKNKPVVQMDPQEQLIFSLRREVQLLRSENMFLREQMASAGLPGFEASMGPVRPLVDPRTGSSAPTSTGRSGASGLGSPLHCSPPRPDAKRSDRVDPRTGRPVVPLPSSADLKRHLAGKSIEGLSKQELVQRLKESQNLLTGYATENERLIAEYDSIRSRHHMLEVDHRDVVAEQERLQGRVQHLEAVFTTAPDGTAHAFTSAATPSNRQLFATPPAPHDPGRPTSTGSSHKSDISLQSTPSSQAPSTGAPAMRRPVPQSTKAVSNGRAPGRGR